LIILGYFCDKAYVIMFVINLRKYIIIIIATKALKRPKRDKLT
jgi:hypothetical protein